MISSNYLSIWSLFKKEFLRFVKVGIQTIIGSNNLDLSNKDHVMALLESVVKFENKNNEKALNYYDIDSRDKAADLFISSFTK